MIRARFWVNPTDYRPVNWPIKHPYWCTGYADHDGGRACIVAYADDEAEIMLNWPDATGIDSEPRDEYTFTGRFPKPTWFTAAPTKEASE